MNVSSCTHGHYTPVTQAGSGPQATESAVPASVGVTPVTDVIELSGVVVDAAVPTDALPDGPVAPDADPADVPAAAGKLTGHARVAQNIQRRVERLIARESGGVDAARASAFSETVTGLAAAYAADPSAAPSGVLAEIRAAVRTLHQGPAPTPTADPIDPTTPDLDTTDPISALNPGLLPGSLGAQAVAAYAAADPEQGSLTVLA